MSWFRFQPYVPVAKRQANAQKEMAKLAKGGKTISPVRIEGRVIASTFWGKAWCDNLEAYSDFANRLPRGKTYVRNGSVVHLEISEGKIIANVSGSELYTVTITIDPLKPAIWSEIQSKCAGQIGSVIELLQGKLAKGVMQIVTAQKTGLFPSPGEIKMRCSCPDYAGCCKHVAAVMYGVGHRLDTHPDLLFKLRQVDHLELIAKSGSVTGLHTGNEQDTIASDQLEDVFGIELSESPQPVDTVPAQEPASKKTAKKPTAKKKAVVTQAAVATVVKTKTTTRKATTKTKKAPATPKTRIRKPK